MDNTTDLGLMILGGDLKCVPLSKVEGKEKVPYGLDWGLNLYKHCDLPKDRKEITKFALGTNSFPDMMSVIDIDITKGLSRSDFTDQDETIYKAFEKLARLTFSEQSLSKCGRLHIYVQNSLSLFKKSTKLTDNITLEIFGRTEGGNGYCVVPTFDQIGGVNEIRAIPHLDKLLESLGVRINTDKADTAPKHIKLMKQYHELTKPAIALSEIKDALAVIPNKSCDYDAYIQIGMSIHEGTGGAYAGFELWDEWTQDYIRYSKEDNNTSWESFKPADPGQVSYITINTLFHIAKEHGYIGNNPREVVPDSASFRFPTLPDFCELVARADTVSPFPISVSFYVFAASLSGVIGRCFRTQIEGEPTLGTVGMITLCGAPSSSGKDKLLNVFEEPIKEEIYLLEKRYAKDKNIYNIRLRNYEKELEEFATTDLPASSEPATPKVPIDPSILHGNATANGVRTHIGKINGNMLLLVPEFKTMLGNVMSNINDWSALFCSLWSGKMPLKLTGARNDYTTSKYPSFGAVFMDQPSTFEELMEHPIIKNDGILARAFCDQAVEGEVKELRSDSTVDKDHASYIQYSSFVKFFLAESNRLALDDIPPINIEIGGRSLKKMIEFKEWAKEQREDIFSPLANITGMLGRAFENATRLYVTMTAYKEYREASNPHILLEEMSSRVFDDLDLAEFSIGVVKYNLMRNSSLETVREEYRENPNIEKTDKIQKILHKSNKEGFTAAQVATWRSVRVVLKTVRANKTGFVGTVLTHLEKTGYLEKIGKVYHKIQ